MPPKQITEVDSNRPQGEFGETVNVSTSRLDTESTDAQDGFPQYRVANPKEHLGRINSLDVAKFRRPDNEEDLSGLLVEEKLDNSSGQWEMKQFVVEPVVDLSQRKDYESDSDYEQPDKGIRNGFNHPAVLVDINKIYKKEFAEASKGEDFRISRFVMQVEKMGEIRKNPDAVFKKSFTASRDSWAQRALGYKDVKGKESLHEEYSGISKWCNGISERILKYPNAFLYSEKGITDSQDNSTVVAFVRPSDEDTSISVFVNSGLAELSAQGLTGQDYIDIAKVIDPNAITYQVTSVQNQSGYAPERVLSLQEISNSIVEGYDIEFEEKQAILNRLASKTSEVKLTFKKGWNAAKDNISQADFETLKSRLEKASVMPWPKVPKEAPKEEQTNSNVDNFFDSL